jgi:hypothetical protein
MDGRVVNPGPFMVLEAITTIAAGLKELLDMIDEYDRWYFWNAKLLFLMAGLNVVQRTHPDPSSGVKPLVRCDEY